MKKFVSLSAGIAGLILLFFAAEMFSQKPITKVTAFNASLGFETKKEYKKAIEELTKIYDTEKNDYLVNLRLGWLYYCTGEYGKSVDYYTRSCAIRKKSVEPLLGVTLPLAALNKWTEVRKAYTDALAIDPNNYTANLRLGQNFLALQDYKTAAKYLEKAVTAFPGQYEANSSLAWTYYYLGKKTEARELFINTLMLSPNDTLALKGLDLAN